MSDARGPNDARGMKNTTGQAAPACPVIFSVLLEQSLALFRFFYMYFFNLFYVFMFKPKEGVVPSFENKSV